MSLAPRVRPLGPPSPSSPPELAPALHALLSWADGLELEPNVLPAAEDIGIDRIRPAADLGRLDDGSLVFGDSRSGGEYVLRPDGGVDVMWGPDDRDRGDDRGRSAVARSLDAALGDLMVLQRSASFEGQPTLEELLTSASPYGASTDGTPRLVGGKGPDLAALDERTRGYVAGLPEWLQEVLARRNGGSVSGVAVPALDPGDRLRELFCVAPRADQPVTEASSLREALITQGLDPRMLPIGLTSINALVLARAGTRELFLLPAGTPASAGASAFVVLGEDSERLIAALTRAAHES